MNRWLTKEQVIEIEGCNARWIERNVEKLNPRYDTVGRNGRMTPLYDAHCLSAAGQEKWLATRKVVGIDAVREGESDADIHWEASASAGEMLTGLTKLIGTSVAPAGADEIDLTAARARLDAIEPLLQPEKHPAIWRRAKGLKSVVHKIIADEQGVSKRTIYCWQARYEGTAKGVYAGRKGLAALIDRARADKGKSRKANPAALDVITFFAIPDRKHGGFSELTITEAKEAYDEERAWRALRVGETLENGDLARLKNWVDQQGRLREEALLPEMSYGTFRNLVDALPRGLGRMARRGPEFFGNADLAFSYRDYEKIAPLDFVVMDHRQLDISCMIPDRTKKCGWRLGRPWLTAAIDMRTRRWLSWVIVETPNSGSITTALKRLLMEHGRPKEFYWDNGQDFDCKWLDAVLLDLGTKVTHSLPRRARSKMIEPAFKRVAAFDRQTEWWCGNSPGSRSEYYDARVEKWRRWEAGEEVDPGFLALDEVRALYQAVRLDLNRKPHSGHGMRKIAPVKEGYRALTPDECWAELAGDVVRETIPNETLMFLFRKTKKLKVRHSQIQMSVYGTRFIYEPMPPLDANAFLPLNDREVELKVDPLDLGTVAVWYDRTFMGLARNMELRGMGEEQFKIDEANRRRAARWVREWMDVAHSGMRLLNPVERLRRRNAAAGTPVEPDRREVIVCHPEEEKALKQAAGMEGFSFEAARPGLAAETERRDEGGDFDFFSK